MATIDIPLPREVHVEEKSLLSQVLALVRTALAPLASLKLTLVLLAMGIFLIFAGTLAQAKAGMWEAVSKYFSAWFVWIDLQIFFPEAWFRIPAPWIYDIVTPGMKLPFLGGATIGLAMLINLGAAYIVRFLRSNVGLTRALAGLGVIALGATFTWLIVGLGDYRQGLSERPFVSWEATALLTLLGAILCSLGLLMASIRSAVVASSEHDRQQWTIAGLSGAGALVSMIGCVLLFYFFKDVSALRILWQLLQGTLAGLILLLGSWLLFDKRAGIVLLHSGVALMMLSQLLVSLWAKEEQMVVLEGNTATYAQDIRSAELAVLEHDGNEERQTVIPAVLLQKALRSGKGELISHDTLPFDLRVLNYFPNAELHVAEKGDKNPATAGIGLEQIAKETAVHAGAASGGEVDFPAAYVQVLDKNSGKELGTYLASVQVTLANFVDQVRVGKKTYDLSLRFIRDYKPYQVKVLDVRKEDYPGSATPRKFESDIVLTDPRYGVERDVTIFMNNPFRYLGETFYQSNYRADPMTRKEETTFQVVRNHGWMLPYVACMIVAVGMVYQFVSTFMRFTIKDVPATAATPSNSFRTKTSPETAVVLKKIQEGRKGKRETEQRPTPAPSWWSWFIPSWGAAVTVGLAAIVIAIGLAWPKPKVTASGGKESFDLYAFGQLPVVSGGRAKPLDSLARETLLAMSNRHSYSTWYYLEGKQQKEIPLITEKEFEKAREAGAKIRSRSHSAIEWLLTAVADPETANDFRVIRIESPEVQAALKLPLERQGMLYSMNELRESATELDALMGKIREKNKDDHTLFDAKLIELDSRLQAPMKLMAAFVPQPLPKLPKRAKDDPQAMDDAIALLQMVTRMHSRMLPLKPPLAVPVRDEQTAKIFEGEKWLPYSTAVMMDDARSQIIAAGLFPDADGRRDEGAAKLHDVFAAYAEKDSGAFNRNVQDYSDWIADKSPQLDTKGDHRYRRERVEAESWFNQLAPFGWTQGMPLYLVALVVSLLGLMAFRRNLGSAAFWLLVVVFLLHTIALGTRMYISGRPPVTNLYSSAVFIAWAGVLIGLVLEGGFRLGVGNVIAAIAGVGGLMIAHMLSFEGDTIGVEVAVLDTQFWLSTHVVCITLGYASTFMAGFLGFLYIMLGLFTPSLSRGDGKLLARMIYGVVCFAMFFSFFGTVLGGLWADDSWGRFWGWDPKENGALIIVLWNAFILHAKWDKLANERGLAVLAVFGNIVTCWSWFGTNQLGVGLHSYGFTQGVLLALGAIVAIHLLIIGLGLLPKFLWRSHRAEAQIPMAEVIG